MLDKTCLFEYIVIKEHVNAKNGLYNQGGPFDRLGVLAEGKSNKSTLSMD
jgi:hypothetical protein